MRGKAQRIYGRQEREDPGTMDIPMGDDSEFQMETIMDDPMPEEATQNEFVLCLLRK
jgi:hypothetical protein